MAIRWIARLVAVLGVTLLLPATAAQIRGSCVVVDSPSDVRLPDGTLAPRGTLRLCVERNLTPVTVLHVVSANGVPLGLYPARVDRSEASGLPRPLVAFAPLTDGTLALSGYAEGGGRALRCRFAPAPVSARAATPWVWLAGRVE